MSEFPPVLPIWVSYRHQRATMRFHFLLLLHFHNSRWLVCQHLYHLFFFNYPCYFPGPTPQSVYGAPLVGYLSQVPCVFILFTTLWLVVRFPNTEYITAAAAAAAAKLLQSCPTLCDPIDGSLPDFSILGILQARVLERVAMNISLIVSKAVNRCIFLIEGNPNTPTCYLMLITNGSQGTAPGLVFATSLCLPYAQTRPCCPLFTKHITIHIAVAPLHMVSPLPQFLLPYFTSIRLLLSFRALTWITLIPHLLFLSTFSRFQDPN